MTDQPAGGVRYLVDTSAWLDVLQPRAGKEALRGRVRELVAADQVVTIGAVQVELLRGTRDEAEFDRLSKLFSSLERLPTGEHDWDEAARLGFRLRRLGLTIGVPDLLIATMAIAHSLVVLHSDGDFDLMSKRLQLAVESYA